MRVRRRVRPDRTADVPAAGDVELPAPGRLALTAGWNLAESLGLPLLAYAVGARLGGQGPGMAAAAAMAWLTAAIRKVLTGSIPGLLVISGLVLTLQAVLVLATGSVLLFLLQFPVANLALCIAFAWTAPPGLDRFFRTVTWMWAGIFAASAIGLAVLLAAVPTPVFLLLTTLVTVAGVAAGTLLSVLWFIRMLRRCGLRVRF